MTITLGQARRAKVSARLVNAKRCRENDTELTRGNRNKIGALSQGVAAGGKTPPGLLARRAADSYNSRMPAVYDKLGIRFLYPDNWTLDESDALSGQKSVSVHSPTGAFWSIAVEDVVLDPDELAAAALKTLKAEYEHSESEAVHEQIGTQSLDGYDVNFFYLDFTNTAQIRGFRTSDASCLILCQAEDRELEKVGPVFRAITASLLAP
jgi:hypothetical protein